MILHDVVTLTFRETVDKLSGATPRTQVFGLIPAEVNPIETEPASDSGPIVIRYRFVTNVDLSALIDAQDAVWTGSNSHTGTTIVLTYDGKTITPEAGYERHKILGRFHHIEAIMKDFGATGA